MSIGRSEIKNGGLKAIASGSTSRAKENPVKFLSSGRAEKPSSDMSAKLARVYDVYANHNASAMSRSSGGR